MKYYIAENGQPAGPFEMKDLMKHGLNPDSQVWNEKMSGWTRAREVPELMSMLGIQQPIAPQPVQPVQPSQPVQPQSPYAPQQQQPEQSPYAPKQQQPEQSPYAPKQQQPEQSPYAPQQQQPEQSPSNRPEATQQQGYGQQPSPYAQPQYQQPQQPQYQQQQYQQMPYSAQPYAPQSFPPKNWMTESIIFTVLSVVCCCNPIALITGIIAIVNAGKVNGMFQSGNTQGATESASTAKMWALITLGILVAGAIISTIFFVTNPEIRQAFQDGYENGYTGV
ncbi:MAG: DUF4339 domain-containing protein [Muribaculaceae bacterium]|nr:DUF4339 domain-containing protein [Muribaculaceae bacterium]